MKTNINTKSIFTKIFLAIYSLSIIAPALTVNAASSDLVVSPFKKVSKLECRFQDYSSLDSGCKQNLPVLKTKDYSKYIKKNWGYNEYTRFYTELWASSYKYGWDVWYGWHMWTDIATAKWTPVHSMAAWKVIVSKYSKSRGNVITVAHNINWKKVFSNYAHLSKLWVKVWKKVKAWEYIWEVGSTWNSTWNHLHLQIDLDTPFHPYYPSYKKCPYSYYKITEEWVCFDDLKNSTIDPLLFLETWGKILDNLSVKVSKVNIKNNNTNTKKTTKKSKTIKKVSSNVNKSIFNKTVYLGYPKGDVREVQQIFRDLWKYNWDLTWNYKDILNIVIKFQLDKKLISSKKSDWAGRFWPKTRASVKKEYDKYIAKWGKRNYVTITDKYSKTENKQTVKVNIPTKKIARTHILTRAEIEKREIDDFLRLNRVEVNFSNIWWNIKKGQTWIIKLDIFKKKKNKPYRWDTPLNITVVTDESMLKVFPKKMFYFERWHRDIKLKALKNWNTTVKVKLWNRVLKSFKIKVYSKNQTIYPNSWKIYASSKIALGQEKKAIVLFKDNRNKRLLNLEYGSTYTLKAEWNSKICLKSWSLKDIKKIYYRNCKKEDFKKEIKFSYKDTVAWVVLFDYKASWKNANIKIINNYNNKVLTQKKLVVTNPVDIKRNYVYSNDVVAILNSDIAKTKTKWYFMKDSGLTWMEAKNWIKNSLDKAKSETKNYNIKKKINSKLAKLNKEKFNKYKTITRKEFLEKTYNYLTLNNVEVSVTKKYFDLDDDLNKKANQVFSKNLTWKDKFGEHYFRPNTKITRWEAAFFLNQMFIKNDKYFLTVK